MPLANRLGNAQAGGSAPPYPTSLQPGYPGQQAPSQSPAPGGYSQPGYNPQQPNYNPQQSSYNRPPPPPPGQSPYPQQTPYAPQSPYPGQSPAYGSPAPPQQPFSPPFGQSQPFSPQNQPPQPYGGYGGQPQQPPPGQQGGYPGGPPPGGPQGQYGQQQYPPPQQQQQGGYPGGPPPQQQQYGPPGGAGPGDAGGYQRELEKAVGEKQLQRFYGPGTPGAQRLPQIAQRSAQQVDRLCQAWRIQREIANDIVRLGLYDVIIYIDDSGSMSFEENGERIKDLQLILQRVAFAATLFDDDGIEIRFMNDDDIPQNLLSGIRSDQQIEQLMANKRYKGLTPFGTKLRQKVLDPLVIPKLRGNNMQKPVLIIGITDGQPAGENTDALVESVRYAYGEASRSGFGPGALSFQFAQVGNDAKATEFLAKLDNDPQIGPMVDCTSNYENESAEMAKAHPPVDLTPDLWMIKLILGAIDPSYDTKDEKKAMGAGGGQIPPGPMYGSNQGQPPQYGQPQYGAPPQQQPYGQPQYGGAPQGGPGGYRPPPGPPGGQGYPQQGPPGGYQQGYPPQGGPPRY